MNILNLLEAKFSKPIYAYHASKRSNLNSIIKNGLIQNKKLGGYGSGGTTRWGTPLTPLTGIYFCNNIPDADTIAFEINETDPAVIIICQIQLETAYMDEDSLIDFYDTYNDKIYDLVKTSFFGRTKQLHDISNNIIEQQIESIISKMMSYTSLKNINFNQNKEVYKNSLRDYIYSIIEYLKNKNEITLLNFRKMEEKLTIRLKNLLKASNKSNDNILKTFRVVQPIGFNGANKIVGIYDYSTNYYWGNIRGLDDFYKKYNSNNKFIKYETPLKLLYALK